MKKPDTVLIDADTTVYDLVATNVMEELTNAELIVFLRLLVARERYPVRMPVRNAELHRDPSTAGRALSRLRERRVVRVRYDASGQRTVEVVR